MKKTLKIVVDILAWVLLVLAFLITLIIFSSEKNNGVPNLFGVMPMTVESDSMKPTFKEGDLIFVKKVDLFDLKEDDVITFYTIIEGKRVKNTHRIIEINESNGTRSFITKGDNNPIADTTTVFPADIIGIWKGSKISGAGKILSFLRTKKGFFICIVIPMALFFLFELYKFIVVLIEIKKPSISEEDEEEIKKKAIEEYLAAEKAKAAAEGVTEEATKASEQVEEIKSDVQNASEAITEAISDAASETKDSTP